MFLNPDTTVVLTVPSPEAMSFAEQVPAAAKRRLDAQAGEQKQTQPARRATGAAKRTQLQQVKKKVDEKEKPSEVEVFEGSQVHAELEWKRATLLQNIKMAIAKFEVMLAELTEEKVVIPAQIVLAELRFLAMLREFKLLAKLELNDHELNQKLHVRQRDMDAIDGEVAAQQDNLKAHEEELEESQKQLKKLAREFEQLMDSSLNCHEQLQTNYNYSIRKNSKLDEGDEVEVDVTTLDVEQVKRMFEAEAIQKQSDTCPADCDPGLFDKVFDLREARMVFEGFPSAGTSQSARLTCTP
jgi:hypothetical protein